MSQRDKRHRQETELRPIAEQQKIHAPTFPGRVLKFALPFLVPMLLVVWWLFFRR